MPTTRTYSPLPPMIPVGEIFRADPCGPRVPDPCPHTYGVRVGMCAAVATEPCRPTACTEEHPNPATTTANYPPPFRHTLCRFRPRRTATVWRNLQQYPHPHSGETYTFFAKEKDTETGLSYFGSRYYSSDLSIWLSVDPMSAKYPFVSPYVYCTNNPINIVDPDGEDIIGALIGILVGATTEIISQTIANGMNNLSEGKGFFNEWSDNMDWADVGISAAVGALDGLAPGAGKLIGQFAGDAAKAAVDLRTEEGNRNLYSPFRKGDYHKSWAATGMDLATNVAGTLMGKVSGLDNLSKELGTFSDGWFGGFLFVSSLKGSLSGLSHGTQRLIEKEFFPNVYKERQQPRQNTSSPIVNSNQGCVIIGPIILIKKQYVR